MEEKDLKVSKAQQRAVNKYVKNNYDRINVTFPKWRKEELKAGVKEARRQRKLRESNMELEKGDFFAMLISAYGVFIPIALVILGIICAVVILMFGRG